MDIHDGGVPSQEEAKETFFRVSTPAGRNYIVSFTALKNAAKNFDSDRGFGLFKVLGRQEGELKNRLHHLPLKMSDISPYVEVISDIEIVGRATLEDLASKKPPLGVSGP